MSTTGVADAGSNKPFRDPLNTPADVLIGALNPAQQPILAAAQAGKQLVGVGLRGLIVLSDDDGLRWHQISAPVQSDLVAVQFPTSQQGWATGHEGVILHTADGGQSWTKQLDGRISQSTLPVHYRQRIDAGETAMQPFLDEINLNTSGGPTLPFLSVYFEDGTTGYAVGSFGMIVMTRDGGKTWIPWLDHIDNPDFLNLNDIRRIGSEIVIVGEKGSVFRLDRAQQRFVSISTTYIGSFFGIVGNQDFLLAFGLAGTVYRSRDGGANWDLIASGVHATLTAGSMSADGSTVLLATENGQLLASDNQGQSFRSVSTTSPMLFTAMIPTADGGLVLAGYQGLAKQPMPGQSPATSGNH
ncbi:MAG: hypothetical protein JWQ90_856 [Hydrocarboniphaga sp.]|uniref:WD40/YVTN/BNR-like repeat-containing protein n=1 Tax=Hydrocarboniphaga sp. TaxID=2033016 RepID=UPI0026140AB4|nr:YCF48-related protein [Hydrocarboniphaga sp.]MDB5968406.1 hypothetical protein [Hydrocarboniphaga sp.]